MSHTVLIVDDHPAFRASARTLLEDEGFDVVGEAEDGDSALELVQALEPNRGVCEKLVLSPKTVESHVNSIFNKLRLAPAPDDHRRVLAVLAFLRS